MKKIALIFAFVISLLDYTLHAQTDALRARIEYEDAEKAFSEENYEQALTKLTNAKQYIGSWQSRVSYLQILCLDKTLNYSSWSPKHAELKTEVSTYLDFASKN